MRSPTLAAHAELLAAYTDHLIAAVRAGDLDEIETALAEVASFLPPDGFSKTTALVLVLAAQIDPLTPWHERLGWVAEHDPALFEAAVA